MKIKMSLRTKELLQNGVFGMAWIIIGVQRIFDFNKMFYLVAVVLMGISAIATTASFFIKTEDDEEDFDDLDEAGNDYKEDNDKYDLVIDNNKFINNFVYNILYSVILVCSIITFIKQTWIVDLSLIIPFLIGGISLVRYIFFIVYDKCTN